MSKIPPNSITINEAVARMVNIDYIPDGYSLLEILNFLREEAEIEVENAIIDRLGTEIAEGRRRRFEICTNRYELALNITRDIRNDLDKVGEGILKKSDESLSETRLVLSSVADWASDRYGIELPDWETDSKNRKAPPEKNHVTPPTDSPSLKGSRTMYTEKHFNSTYVAFAFLIEAFARADKSFMLPSGPNVNKIANHLEKLATEANDGLELKNQNHESIRKRISHALQEKEAQLPEG